MRSVSQIHHLLEDLSTGHGSGQRLPSTLDADCPSGGLLLPGTGGFEYSVLQLRELREWLVKLDKVPSRLA